ncbi:MAG: hypothetical protein NC124_16390 [Clostridium sp.]|nr:hypothetical protein [Clostridium sp.]
MINIENTYISYDELVECIGEDVIERRVEQFAQEITDFLNSNSLNDIAYINNIALSHAVMDYFSDIERLKNYQKIERINEIKIKAYETFWFLKRKPIQLRTQLDDDKWLYVNEKFLLVRLTSFMLQDDINTPMLEEKRKAFTNYLDTLYYYLKFRRCDAQSIELMLLAFEAGRLIPVIKS